MEHGGKTKDSRAAGTRSGLMRRAAAVAAGAAGGMLVAHLLDPDRGRARRARLQSQAVAGMRRRWQGAIRAGRRRSRWTAGHLAGARHDLLGRLRTHSIELDDNTLTAKIRSEVLGRFPQHPVSVDVAKGVVYLRGEVPSTDVIDDLTARIRGVPGIAGVESYLHLPGRPAPNKEAALHVTG